MLVGAKSDNRMYLIPACALTDGALEGQYFGMLSWIVEQSADLTSNKFSLDISWFKELHWEMVRRCLEIVH